MPDEAPASDSKPQWQQIAEKKRRIQAETIAPFPHLESPANADEITAIDDVAELAGLIASGKFKAYDVALGYILRAVRAWEKVRLLLSWRVAVGDWGGLC